MFALQAVSAAALGHVAAVKARPYLIHEYMHSRRRHKGLLNQYLFDSSLPTHRSRMVVKPAPDLLYLAAFFDVSLVPLKLTCRVPDAYWSLSLYADSTDSFYVTSDSSGGSKAGDYVTVYLLGPQHDARPEVLGLSPDDLGDSGEGARGGRGSRDRPHVRIVQAPCTCGFVLNRTLVLEGRADAADAADPAGAITGERKYVAWYRAHFVLEELSTLGSKAYSGAAQACAAYLPAAAQRYAELSLNALASPVAAGLLAWLLLALGIVPSSALLGGGASGALGASGARGRAAAVAFALALGGSSAAAGAWLTYVEYIHIRGTEREWACALLSIVCSVVQCRSVVCCMCLCLVPVLALTFVLTFTATLFSLPLFHLVSLLVCLLVFLQRENVLGVRRESPHPASADRARRGSLSPGGQVYISPFI
jgi:hypothetical protein